MARVNRTTGFFLVLGVVALVVALAGARWMMKPEEVTDRPDGEAQETGVFCSGPVDVASGLANLVPAGIGKVVAVHVKEGDVVKAGTVLVQLEDKHQRDQLAIAKKEVEAANAKLENIREQLKNHDANIAKLQHEAEQAQTHVKLAEVVYEETKRLADNKVETTAALKFRQAEIALEGARKAKSAAEEGLKKLKAIDATLALREPAALIEKAKLEVKAAESALEMFTIKAPADGQVFEVNYHVGGSAPLPPVDANAARALIFCPNEVMVVRAEIDQEWVMKVRPNQKATLTFRAADRDYHWKGTVERVSLYIQRRRSGVIDPGSFNDARTRECLIRIEPSPNQPIVHGLRMAVEIHPDR